MCKNFNTWLLKYGYCTVVWNLIFIGNNLHNSIFPELFHLKHTSSHLTVLTSTIWSPEMFSKHWWMSVGAIFFQHGGRNSVPHFCFICTSMSDTILSECLSADSCHVARECNGVLVGRFNLYCFTTNICLCCGGPPS